MRELIFDLNKVAQAGEPEERLKQIFDPLFSKFEEKVGTIPASSSQKHTRPQGEILEELVSSVRNVEMRVRDVMDDDYPSRRRFKRRVSPGMLMELTHSLSEGPNDPLQILIFFGMFKDDMPWLYELALEFYRAVTAHNRARARAAHRKLMLALEQGRRFPMFEMFGADSKMMHMMLMDARELIPALRMDDSEETEAEEGRATIRPTRRLRVPKKT